VWSPNGERVAFYSDDGGEAGLWVWEKATGKAERFPGVVVRPLFGFELVRWSADIQRVLCKILPVGMSVAEANALVPDSAAPRRFSPTPADTPSVFVLRANMDGAKTSEGPAAQSNSPTDRCLSILVPVTDSLLSALARPKTNLSGELERRFDGTKQLATVVPIQVDISALPFETGRSDHPLDGKLSV
jgi:hypothetical protein